MSDYIATSADLTSVANAIRTKGGTSAQLAFPADFVQAIEDIETGGGGGGIVLLGSGSVTKTSTTNPLVIPVSYTGTPILVFVCADAVDATAQVRTAIKVYKPPEVIGMYNYDYLTALTGDNASNGAVFNLPGNAQQPTYQVTETQISFPRMNSTQVWVATTYHWFIYGYAA
jgi:hypothetical protein